jgi:diguanylate cyclase (GGDEF)-like protein
VFGEGIVVGEQAAGDAESRVRPVAARAPARAWWWWLLGALPLVVAGPLLSSAGQECAYAVIGFCSVVAVILGVRMHRPARSLPWWLLAAALACGAVANAVWGVGFALGFSTNPRFSAVDVTYFAMYPLLAAGLAIMPARRSRSSAWAGVTEAGIVSCTGAVLAWVLLYDPYVNDATHWSGAIGILLYPIVDVLLVAMAVRMVVAQRRLNRAHLLLLAATVLLTSADVVYFLAAAGGGSWSGPPISVVGWMAAFLLIGVAALEPGASRATTPGDAPASNWRTASVNILLVLIGPAATAYSLLNSHNRDDLDPYDLGVPLTATALVAVLLVIRLTQAGGTAQRRAVRLRQTLGEQAALQESMRHLALHDALTDLPNRRYLEEQILHATARHGSGGLLLLDLDGFKDVNDRLGHAIGDDLLVAVGVRLREFVGAGEVLARPGGDEFAALLPGLSAAVVTARAERVLAALRQPVEVKGHSLHVTASIGIRSLEPDSTAAQALGDADLALYAAKAAGKDCIVNFDATLRDLQAQRIRTVERLRLALEAEEFAVHYQPIVDLDDGAPVAVEALVRWFPPGQSVVGPDLFIPAAEDSGLIVRLGEWVLRRACLDAAGWHERHGTTLAVNVSPRQLSDPDFTAKVRAALGDSGLPATALTLEITEGVLVRSGAHADQALAHLGALRADGVRVAIDDFGTGYSSLAYLRDLPIDTLKIDKSFMPVTSGDAHQTVLVRTIIELARSLDLATVAEGVETLDQANLLRTLGCDRGQGYLFARPAGAAETAARLAKEGVRSAVA